MNIFLETILLYIFVIYRFWNRRSFLKLLAFHTSSRRFFNDPGWSYYSAFALEIRLIRCANSHCGIGRNARNSNIGTVLTPVQVRSNEAIQLQPQPTSKFWETPYCIASILQTATAAIPMPQPDYISRPIIVGAIEHVGNMECRHRQKHEPLAFEYSNPYNDILQLLDL